MCVSVCESMTLIRGVPDAMHEHGDAMQVFLIEAKAEIPLVRNANANDKYECNFFSENIELV